MSALNNGAEPYFWIRSHLGTVLSIKRWSDTHITTSGGGGYVGKDGGYVAPPTVHSHLIQKQEVFLREDNGKEASFVFDQIAVPFREGSRLLAIQASRTPGKPGGFAHVENLDTGEKYAPKLSPRGLGNGLFNGLGAALLITVVLAPIWYAFFVPSAAQVLEDELNSEADRTMARVCPPGTTKPRFVSETPDRCEKLGGKFLLEKKSPGKSIFRRKGNTMRQEDITYYIGQCACPTKEGARQAIKQMVDTNQITGTDFFAGVAHSGTLESEARQTSEEYKTLWTWEMAAVFMLSWLVAGIGKSAKFRAEAKRRHAEFMAAIAQAVAEAREVEQKRRTATVQV